GVDLDPGQQHFAPEVLQVGGLFHDVLAREIVAALLEHLDHGLRDGVTDDDRTIELVGFRKILGQEIQKLFHAGVIVPLRIGNVLQVGGRNDALRVIESGRLDDAADGGGDV